MNRFLVVCLAILLYGPPHTASAQQIVTMQRVAYSGRPQPLFPFIRVKTEPRGCEICGFLIQTALCKVGR